MIDIVFNNRLIKSCDVMHGIDVASLPVFVLGRTGLHTSMRNTST